MNWNIGETGDIYTLCFTAYIYCDVTSQLFSRKGGEASDPKNPDLYLYNWAIIQILNELYLFDVPAHGVVDFEMWRLLVQLSPQHVVVGTLDDQIFKLSNGAHTLQKYGILCLYYKMGRSK